MLIVLKTYGISFSRCNARACLLYISHKMSISMSLEHEHAVFKDKMGGCKVFFFLPVQRTGIFTSIIQNGHQTLSVRTLRVRELSRHDRDTSPVNNQQRNLDAHIGSHIFYEDLYRSNHNVNIHYSLCYQYVTCPTFDRRYLHT